MSSPTPAASPGDRAAQIVGLRVIRRSTGKVEAFVPLTGAEVAMPGYVEHVERGYVDTSWRTERVHDNAAGAGAESPTGCR